MKSARARTLTPIIAGLALLTALTGSTAPANPADRPSSPFDRLGFREIGPASAAGRIDDFAVFEGNPSVFYVATATGGLWKTVNNGTTFESVFDKEGSSSIGDVAIAPGDPNLIWVGTGENNNRQSSSWGDGVYRSADGGRTWKNMGLADSKHIARIIVDPVDHEVIYVAALGSLWGPGGQRGVFKSADGGSTWTNTLFVDDDTGATELVMDPANNKVLYAATYQRRRATWGFNGGGPGSAIYKSTDAGKTWTKLANGIPEGPMGRIGLDVYRKDPNILYARIEHASQGGIYRSEDAGYSWRKMSGENPRPMYFSQIRIDPNDDHRIYVLGVQLHVSDDGGKTFRNDGARNIHVDFHAMWIDPSNSDHMIIGGDGGVGISYDRSKTYVWLNNMPLGQFYHVGYDMRTPYYVCGGLQDNNSWCGPSEVRSESGIANDDWVVVGGGDGFVSLVDPGDHRIVYSESQGGRMNRVDLVTNERKSIRPEPKPGEEEYRWNWNTPILISPHNPSTIFVAANRVFKSTDRGHSWKTISPDLTTKTDRDKLELMGVLGKDIAIAKNDGVSSYGTLVSFAESPRQAGLYYAGSDDGLVHVSRDDGATWTNVTGNIPGLPANTYVSGLAPSRFDPAVVYATFDGHYLNDFEPHVYASSDYGASWRAITGGLPEGEVARTITEDLKNSDALYLGTETGLFVTMDRGGHWMRVKANLPVVPIYEITLHPRDNAMLLATHGRSVWILDDMTPLQQFTEAAASEAFLFEPRTALQRKAASDRMRDFEGDRIFLGRNPERGAVLTFYLKSPAKKLALTIRDSSGAMVREFSADDLKDVKKEGISSIVWDLRVQPLSPPEGQEERRFRGGVEGPLVLPGTYKVSLIVDNREAGSRNVTVSGDPEIQISDSDRRSRFVTIMRLHRLQETANRAAAAVSELGERVAAMQAALKDSPNAPAPLRKSVEDFAGKLEPVRRKLGSGGGRGGSDNVRGRIGMLKSSVMSSTTLPTEIQSAMIAQVGPDLEEAIKEANALIEDLPALYKALAEGRVYPSVLEPIKPIGN